MRRLIVNADDFGVTRGVNRAIIQANQGGIVTSTTIMANSQAFDDAAELARSAVQSGSHLSVGCHVMLVDGAPLLPPSKIPSLGQGCGVPQFRKTLNNFVIAALTDRLNEKEIESEAAAQIERVQRVGIAISHIDTHKHTHMFPSVLRPLLRAAKACGVSAVRNPFEPAFSTAVVRGGWKLRKRHWQMRLLGGFEGNFRREVAAQGMRTTDGALGILATGVLDLPSFLKIVSNIPDGIWEFVCHPGYNDGDLDQVTTRLRESRQRELEVLISAEVRRELDRRGVQLISYNVLSG